MADAVLTPLTRTFTVAWITALALERAAAKAMFDEIYDDKPADFHKSEGDINVYSWGRVGKHNVVVVSLPSGEYGIASAATVAQALRSSLPHIKIGLLVGIGAGIPGEKQVTGGSTISLRDIRLGDVVVSNPDNTNGGVIQFDLVKAKEVRGEYRLERKGFLNSPPMALRTALSELQSRHEMEYSKIPTLIADAFRKFPRMSRMYSHPGLADGADRCKDIYYAQNGEQIERDPRETPEIFYGTIASGNLLEKSAEHRELMLSWLQVEDIHPLCIEMEAAGLMNTFPCLVIRGICDYADSHKNDEWQRYSALTAAGFAKEFLECVEPSAVENTPELHEVLGQRVQSIGQQVSVVTAATSAIKHYVNSERWAADLQWICPVNSSKTLQDQRDRVLKGTGQWFLDDSNFRAWSNSKEKKILFCSGDPGTGKTALATIATSHLESEHCDKDEVVVCLYCDYNQQREQSLSYLLRNILHQLVSAKEHLPYVVQKMREKHDKQRTNPSLDEIERALRVVMQTFSRVWVVVDALDECEPALQESFYTKLCSLASQPNTALMVTSRPLPKIQELFAGVPRINIVSSKSDMQLYAEARIRTELESFVVSDMELTTEVAQGVAEAADGRFLLARLHIDSLKSKPTERKLRDALAALPRALLKESKVYDPAYEEAMNRIFTQPEDDLETAKLILSWALLAQRLLRPRELEHALTVIVGERFLDPTNQYNIENSLTRCAGLVIHDQKSDTIRLVHETTQHYLSRNRARWLPDASFKLSQICTTYLSYDAFLSERPLDHHEMGELLSQYPLLVYAGKFWGVHAKEVEDTLEPRQIHQLHQEINKFFSDRHRQDFVARLLDFNRHLFPYNQAQITCHHLLAHFGLTLFFQRHMRADPSTVSAKFRQDIDARDSFGRTPLWWAAYEGHPAMVDALLDTGKVNTISKDNNGHTLLSQAAVDGRVEVVKMLLDTNRFDVNAKDDHGKTALLRAASRGSKSHERIVQMILETSEVDVNSKDKHGNTALSKATSKGHEEIVQKLLEIDQVDVNSKNDAGETALWKAAQGSHVQIARMLLNLKGVDLDPENKYGKTPLLAAMDSDDQQIAQMLFDTKQFDVTFKEDGSSRILKGAFQGYRSLVQTLLDTKQVDLGPKGQYIGEILLDKAKTRDKEILEDMFRTCMEDDITLDADSEFESWEENGTLSRNAANMWNVILQIRRKEFDNAK